MPKVTQQRPVNNRNVKTTHIPTQTSPSDPFDPWGVTDALRMLLYGSSGTGKTTLWATFPGPIMCLLCSGSRRPGELRSINTAEYRRKVVPVVVQSVEHLLEELDNRGKDFATVVLDHASGFSDLVIKELLGLEEIPVAKSKKAGKGESWSLVSQQQYAQLSVICKEAFRTMLNLPGNVVIVAQERVFGGKDEESKASAIPADPEIQRPFVGAALTPSVAGWLNPACDYIVQAFKRPVIERTTIDVNGTPVESVSRGKGVQYCLRVEPHDSFITKFRVPGGINQDVIVNASYNKIMRVIAGEVVGPEKE